MKFCKDCVHYLLPFTAAHPGLALCSRKKTPTSPVTGLPDGPNEHPFCRAERISLAGNCGVDAIHFKAKEVPHDYSI